MSIQLICGSRYMGQMDALMKAANECAENGQKVLVISQQYIIDEVRDKFPVDESISLVQLLMNYGIDKLKKFRKYYQCDVIVIDMVNAMFSANSEEYVKTPEEFEELFRELQVFSEEEGVKLYLGRYLPPMVARREDKRPLLSDLTPAEQEADEVIGVYRDIVYHHEQTRDDVIEMIDLKRNQRVGIIPNKRNILY